MRLSLSLITAFVMHWTAPFCQTTESLRGGIDNIIRHDTEFSQHPIPGFIIGVMDGDSTYVLPYGTREIGSDQILTASDVFELGSATKVMTADIILQLDEEHILDVFAPLNHYLPSAFQNPFVQATLMDVLTHRSGLPKIPETLGNTQIDMKSPYAGFTKDDLLSWYHNLATVPLGEFRYSHAGYALLELVIEQATGDSYERVFNQYISNMCEMPNTHVDHLLTTCPGYNLAGRKAQSWEFNSFLGSEGAWSNLQDLMTYVRILIDEEETKLMWTTSHPTSDKKLFIAPGWY